MQLRYNIRLLPMRQRGVELKLVVDIALILVWYLGFNWSHPYLKPARCTFAQPHLMIAWSKQAWR